MILSANFWEIVGWAVLGIIIFFAFIVIMIAMNVKDSHPETTDPEYDPESDKYV